jgi:hypothetical protein
VEGDLDGSSPVGFRNMKKGLAVYIVYIYIYFLEEERKKKDRWRRWRGGGMFGRKRVKWDC